MGDIHVPRRHAERINTFYQDHVNVYVNYRRPSGYATTTIDHRGKEKKKNDVYETPYAHFKKVPEAVWYLRACVTFKNSTGERAQ